MLHQLRLEDLQPHLESEFRVASEDGEPVTAILVELRDLATPATMPEGEGARPPFSALLRLPIGYPVIQGIREIEHDELGNLSLFLVPVREDEQGIYFEAVFN